MTRDDFQIAKFQAFQNDSTELLRSVITFSIEILKSAMLINGGAAVALLAFTGAVWSSGQPNSSVQSLSTAILWFGGGVLATMVGTILGYFTQYHYYKRQTHDVNMWVKNTPGERLPMSQGFYFHACAAFCVFVSLVCFCIGAYESVQAFSVSLPTSNDNG